MPTLKTQERAALLAAGGGVVATLATAVACVGPMIAILLGIGGMGFLSRFVWLRVPATIVTAVLLAIGFHYAYRRPVCEGATGRRTGWIRGLLWAGTAFAVTVNLFEYVVLPRL